MAKISKKIIENIIKEETALAKKRYAIKLYESSSMSSIEIEELLRTYFHRVGGIPENIYKLSVLFPILEKVGLESLVDAYLEMAKTAQKGNAKDVLKDVKVALTNIKNDVFE